MAVVTDSCGTCAATQVNLHMRAFAAIADTKAGHAAVRYRQASASFTLGLAGLAVSVACSTSGAWQCTRSAGCKEQAASLHYA